MILVRRAVAGLAILVVVIVLAIGVHSCQVSSRNSALRTYNSNVGSLIQRSDSTGAQFFDELNSASKSSNNVTALQDQLDSSSQAAQQELSAGKALSAPSQVSTAQQNFVTALSLRQSGIAAVAGRIQQALNRPTAENAVNSIAADMEEFLASDVVYTTQTASQIAAALHAAGIPVSSGTIQATNFFSDLGWLSPTYVAGKLGASLPSSATGTCPSVCGDVLNSVSVGGVPLSANANSIPASPEPVFTVNFSNDGENAETNTTIEVSVTTASGSTIPASTVKATTQPGQSYNVQIQLPKSPPAGSAEVTVTVEKVAGETNVSNNTATYPVTFD